jgi:hypothetical protein
VTYDELKQSNSIDFAELIAKQAAGRVQQLPAPEEEVAVRRPEANVPDQLQTMLGCKGIFDDTIAKFSCRNSLGGDSDDGGDNRSGGDADDVSDESSKLPRFVIYVSIYIYTYIYIYMYIYVYIYVHTTCGTPSDDILLLILL